MNPRTPISFCLPHASRHGGGVSEAARMQARALTAAGRPVSVVTVSDDQIENDRVDWGSVTFFTHRYFGSRRYLFAPGLILGLLRAKPALVHVHGVWNFHCAAVLIWSFLTGKPYVVSPHGMLESWVRARSPRLKSIVSFLYLDRFLGRAAGFQVLTGKEREDVADHVTDQPVQTIANFVTPAQPTADKPHWWRPEFNRRRVFLYFGRVHEKKGCEALLMAWEKACATDPVFRGSAALVFCGWLDGLDGFPAAVETLNRQYANVIFAGPQYGDQKHQSLQAADFLVLPSSSEGLPVVVLEAWANARPVIMSAACNLPEGFDHGAALETGTDPGAIRRALLQAHALPQPARAEMGRQGRKLVAARFSTGCAAAHLNRLYEDSLRYWRNK